MVWSYRREKGKMKKMKKKYIMEGRVLGDGIWRNLEGTLL
jgi:hypothetical protein